ncbi:PKD domain-containing protein, partial [Rubripirellula sp.]|nr:PKD domain-containing protein [Rubripirellula sp.]
NFVLLSAKIAAHELAHLMGLRHQDSFGPIGLGIHDPPGIEGYNPIFPGPVGAVETFDHLLGTGASVGSDRFNDLRDLFFSERSAMKLALATADTADVFTVESSTAHSTSATAQVLPLVTVDVPNTLTTGLNADKVFYVQMQSVEGTIEIDPVTGQSENDWYSFTGTAGDTMNIELFSNSLIRYGTGNDNYIDSILRVWYEVNGTMTLVPWFGSEAVNDDIFEPTDSALIDLVLPADGVYYIEVDSFKRDPSSEVFDATSATSPLNPDNPNNYLSHPDLLDRFLSTRDDTDIGNYQLVVSRFDRSNSSDGVDTIVGYGGTDTIDAGDGDDYSLVVTVGSDASLNEGGTLTRTISLVDRAATDWSTSTVDYGDGSGSTSLTVASDKTAALSYTYADSGTYTVSVTIRDDIGQVSNETFDVTVANVAPVVVTLTGEQTPDEGTTQTYSFTASDVGDDTFSVVEISGGDYGTVSNIAINSVTGSGSFDVTYADITSATAANTLSVKLKDSDDAESNVLTLAVTVQNVGTGPSDLSLSASTIEENAASGTSIGTFTTTDSASGGSYTYTLVAGTGDTDNALFSISGDTLLSAATFDYEVATSRSIRVRTTDGSGNTYDKAFTISVTDVADETAPSSSIAALAADSTTASLSISVSGSDAGTSASGVSSYALYYSVGASWILFDTVTPASPNSTFQANPNTLYWFRSVATDAAGNVETKSTSDTYTRVGDVTVPTSEVSSATAADSGLITLAITGEKSNGRPITTFDVYMSVDGAAYEKVASVNSTEVSNGVFSGAATVQGIVDGASHQYAFYTRAIDGNAKTEDAPASADQTITATFSGASLIAQGIDVQKGANARSYIRNVDLLFSADPTELLDAGRIEVERFSLSAGEGSVAAGTGTAIAVSGKSVSGNSLELDFGTLGIGGRWWLGDGFYRIMVDMNNDGNVAGPEDAIFEFYRLFGDANGDGVVNPSDDLVIRSQMNRSGANLDGDVDGSGRVNGRDRLFARRRYNQAIPAWMNNWLDD